MTKVGEGAEDFELPDQDGKIHRLSDYKGKWVLLYFYPKDFTPGCTTEACSLRDNFERFKKFNLIILGVSIDSVARHKKFSQKYKLPFIILSDSEKKAVNLYGVFRLKKFMGREFFGTVRTTFLVNPKGQIAKIYEKVNPITHAFEILSDLKSLMEKR